MLGESRGKSIEDEWMWMRRPGCLGPDDDDDVDYCSQTSPSSSRQQGRK